MINEKYLAIIDTLGFKLLEVYPGNKKKRTNQKVLLSCNNCNKSAEYFTHALPRKKYKFCSSCMECHRRNPYKEVGKFYKKLEVVEYIKTDKAHKTVFSFKCTCGKLFEARLNNVIYGKTSSCGCKKVEYIIRTYQKPIEEIAITKAMSGMRRVEKRGLKYTITREDVKDLIFKPCFYCGSEGETLTKSGKRSILHNGIDRIDSSKGYILSNIRVCCKICNRMKGVLTMEEFKDRISIINKRINYE
jgi:hypothetical protein